MKIPFIKTHIVTSKIKAGNLDYIKTCWIERKKGKEITETYPALRFVHQSTSVAIGKFKNENEAADAGRKIAEILGVDFIRE